MNELIEIFTQNAENIWNIQPYVNHNNISNIYLTVSLLLLFISAATSQLTFSNFFNTLPQFLQSEQFSLAIYRTKKSINITDVLLGIFFILQLTYLIYLFIAQNSYTSVKLIAYIGTGILIVYALKIFIYQSLRLLLPKRVEVEYYLFNYIYFTFFIGLILFGLNIILIQKTIDFTTYWVAGILLILYILLLIRLFTISLRYKIVLNIYIFLYFCTLEIAPLVIIAKHNSDWFF